MTYQRDQLPSQPTTINRRDFLKKVSAGAIFLPGVASFLAACTDDQTAGTTVGTATTTTGAPGTTTTTAPRDTGITGLLRVANPGEPNFIDPANALEVTEFAIIRNVYDGLLLWNADYTALVPGLALSWESNDEATEWVFNLREGVSFHDGSTFNSSVARKTIEYYLDKEWGFVAAGLQEVDDSDPAVLRVLFSDASPDFARNQAAVMYMMSPMLIDEDAAGERAVGTGPFRFAAWNPGESVVLEANEDYWGEGPFLETVELQNIADQTAAITALRAGDIDLVLKVPPRQVAEFRQDANFGVSTTNSWTEGHLLFRTDQTPTDDVLVRQAIAYAIDRESIVENVLLGEAVVANTPLPPGTYGAVDPPTGYTHDPDMARKLLSDAGLDGLELRMSVFAAIRVLGEEVSQAIVGQLAEAGINVALDIQEAGVAVTDLIADEPEHQLFHVEYGYDTGGPLHFTLGSALGHPRYDGEELNSLIQQVSTTPDGPDRMQALAEAQDVFMRELPHLPLYHLNLSDVFRADLEGYTVPKDGYQPVLKRASFRS